MAEVAASREDALRRRQVRSREMGVTMDTESSENKLPNVFRNDKHGFATLLGRQVCNVNRCLKYRVVLSGEITNMGAKGLGQGLTGVAMFITLSICTMSSSM